MPTTFYPPHHFGGDATFVERLAHALARRGHRVDVICNVDAYRMLRPYFLFAGRLEAIKGLQDVIPHFDDEAEAELWIAGSGDYEPQLRKLAASSPRVRFLGQKTADRAAPTNRPGEGANRALALL
jgi:glycogen synthase